jgi:hypothetical protein
MAPHFLTILTDRNLPKSRQARETEPVNHQQKDGSGLQSRG